MYKSSDAITDSPIDQDVLCPLCNYNLRGLAEARCPECGGQFNWDELRDPAKRLHPYLFEHHPARKIWSLFRTLRGGLLPRRFWTTLLPVQPSYPKRLILYWLICTALALMSCVIQFAEHAAYSYQISKMQRPVLKLYYLGPGVSLPNGATTQATTQMTAGITQMFGSVQKYIDETFPMPPSRAFFERVAGLRFAPSPVVRLRLDNSIQSTALLVLVFLLWPWCAAGVMLLFRASMRHAAVRSIHLLRVTVYCMDILVWVAALWLAADVIRYVSGLFLPVSVRYLTYSATVAIRILAGGALLGGLILTYRLGVAMGKYLRFRHAMAMAFSVQIILTLLVLVVLKELST
jgi:hypothetical protein